MVAQLEAKHKIQRMGMRKELIKVQKAMEKRDRETEKKELEAKIEKIEVAFQATLEKKEMMAALEKKEMMAALEKKEMMAILEKKEMMAILENERRERLAEKKEMMAVIEKHEKEHQHQIEQLKSEARISQMEQQLLEVRAYTAQGIPTSQPAIQRTGIMDPTPQRGTELLLLQRIQQMEKEREQLKATVIQPMSILSNDSNSKHLHPPDTSRPKTLQPAPHKSAVVPHTPQIVSRQASQISSPQVSKPNVPVPLPTSITPSRSNTQHQHQVAAALPQGGTKTAQGRPVPLPGDSDNHFFLSHCQSTGGDQTNAIYLELRQLGFACWYDNRADDLTKEGMRQGIVHAAAFLLFLSKGVLDRPFCKYFYLSSSNSHVEFTIHSFLQANLRSERP
jgi:hypothetical protein